MQWADSAQLATNFHPCPSSTSSWAQDQLSILRLTAVVQLHRMQEIEETTEDTHVTWVSSVVSSISCILCSWFLYLSGWTVNCSKYAVQLLQKICHQFHSLNTYDCARSTCGGPEGASRAFWSEVHNWISSAREVGAWLDSTWRTRLTISNFTRRLTGSQWSWRSIGVMCHVCL